MILTCFLLNTDVLFYSRVTNLVKIDTNGLKDLAYQPGDHLSVYPSNEPELVNKLLTKIDTTLSDDETARLEFLEGNFQYFLES